MGQTCGCGTKLPENLQADKHKPVEIKSERSKEKRLEAEKNAAKLDIEVSQLKLRGDFLEGESHRYSYYCVFNFDGRDHESSFSLPRDNETNFVNWGNETIKFIYLYKNVNASGPTCKVQNPSEYVVVKVFQKHSKLLGGEHKHLLVCEAKLQVNKVLYGPVHHSLKFDLKDVLERENFKNKLTRGTCLQLSYNIQIKQVADWTIDFSKVCFQTKVQKSVNARLRKGLDISNIDKLDEVDEKLTEDKKVVYQLFYGFDENEHEEISLDALPATASSTTALFEAEQFLNSADYGTQPQLHDKKLGLASSSVVAAVSKKSLTETVDNLVKARRPNNFKKGAKYWDKARKAIMNQPMKQIVTWSNENGDIKANLHTSGPYERISGGLIKLIIYEWKSNLNEDREVPDKEVFRKQKVGEVWLTLERLLDSVKDYTESGVVVSFDRVKVVSFKKTTGRISGEIIISPIPVFLQNSSGALNEKGETVLISSPIMDAAITHDHQGVTNFLTNLVGINTISGNAKELGELTHRLTVTLTTPVERGRHDNKEKTKGKTLYCVCNDILKFCLTSEKETVMTYVYKRKADMMSVSEKLISLWQVLLEWIDTVKVGQRIFFFDLISAIMMRGELGPVLFFYEKDNDEESKTHMNILLKLRGIMYRTLKWAILKLNNKSRHFRELRVFCARIVAIMCFRIRPFGTFIYKGIYAVKDLENDAEKLGTKAAFMNLHNLHKGDQSDYLQLLDWTKFHSLIDEYYGSSADEMVKSEINEQKKMEKLFLNPDQWYIRIRRRETFCRDISEQWVIHVLEQLGSLESSADRHESFGSTPRHKHQIDWNKLEGYKYIVAMVKHDLQRRPLTVFPESLMRLTLVLLSDTRLLDEFSQIIIRKCNILSVEHTTEAADILSSWFSVIQTWPQRFRTKVLLMRYGPISEEGVRTLLDNSLRRGMTDVPKETIEKIKETDRKTENERIDKAIENVDSVKYVNAWDFDRYSIYLPQIDVWKFVRAHVMHVSHLDNEDEKRQQKEALKGGKGDSTPGMDEDNMKVDKWFSRLYCGKPVRVPTGFDMPLMFKFLWSCTTSDRYQTVLKGLEFMYNHWKQFPPSFADQLRNMFLVPIVGEDCSPITYVDTIYDTSLYFYGEELGMSRDESRTSYSSFNELSLSRSVSDVHAKLPNFAPTSHQDIDVDLIRSRTHCGGNVGTQQGAKPVPLFVKLFYHWCFHVREFFHTLLIYRLSRANVSLKNRSPTLAPLPGTYRINHCVLRIRAATNIALHSTPEYKHLWKRLWNCELPTVDDNLILFERFDSVMKNDLQSKLNNLSSPKGSVVGSGKNRNRKRSSSISLSKVEASVRKAEKEAKEAGKHAAENQDISGKDNGEDYSLEDLSEALALLKHKKWPNTINPCIISEAVREFEPRWEQFNSLVSIANDGEEIQIPDLDAVVAVETTGAYQALGGSGKVDGSMADNGIKPQY